MLVDVAVVDFMVLTSIRVLFRATLWTILGLVLVSIWDVLSLVVWL